MIQFQITHSPDDEIINHHTYYKQKLIFARSKGDFLINEPGLLNPHLALELNEKGLFAKSGPEVEFFHVNGKRYRGLKNLKNGDDIKIENTIIKIKNFMYDESEDLNKKFKQNIESLISDTSPINEILDILEDEFKQYEK